MATEIQEEVLRDPQYPMSRIADQLLPYLKLLADQFHPEKIILFGSYAYGQPDQESDVDLLVVKTIAKSSVSERREILKAWRPLRWAGKPLAFELLVVSPLEHEARLSEGGCFYSTIARRGVLLT